MGGLKYEQLADTAIDAPAAVFRPMGRLRQALGKVPARRKKSRRKAKRRNQNGR